MTALEQLQRTAGIFTKMWSYLRLSGHPEASCRDLKRRYAQELRRHLDMEMTVTGRTEIEGPAIYVCNHISYVDIPLVMGAVPEGSFVSKSEVASYPLIGTAARRIETVFVKRDNKSSREGIRQSLAQSLTVDKKKIIVFPSSTTTIYKTERWRKGVFEIAHEYKIPLIPVRLTYMPLRDIAYIDDDNLLMHMYHLVANPHLKAHIEFGEAIQVTHPIQDCERVKEWCEANMDFAPAAVGAAIPS